MMYGGTRRVFTGNSQGILRARRVLTGYAQGTHRVLAGYSPSKLPEVRHCAGVSACMHARARACVCVYMHVCARTRARVFWCECECVSVGAGESMCGCVCLRKPSCFAETRSHRKQVTYIYI